MTMRAAIDGMEDLAHGEDGQLEQTVAFPFDEVAYELGESIALPAETDSILTDEEWERFGAPLEKLFRWIYQDPHHRNLNGVAIRALIVSWIVVKELQPLSLTELSRMYGKDKQSLGRWVEQLKKDFPGVRNCHMKE